VLPAWDPLRVAEEIAVLDHLTKGRFYAGFARGYQDRWVNVLGQQYHATGAPWMARRLTSITVRSMKRCSRSSASLDEDAITYNGKYYKNSLSL